MPKLYLGLGTGVGVWTVGMGVTALTGEFSGERLEILSLDSVIKLGSARDIKTKHTELPCIGNLFGDVTWGTTQSAQIEIKALTNTGIEGCLSVWWNKETYGDKWKGSWNLLWGMKDNNSGIVLSSDAKANDGKVTAETVPYILKKEADKWSLVSESTSSPKEIKNENLSKKEDLITIPKEGKELIDPNNGWDFNFDSKDICSLNQQCKSESPEQTSSNLNWKFIPENNKSLAYEWIKNMDNLILFSSFIKTPLSQIRGHFQLIQ